MIKSMFFKKQLIWPYEFGYPLPSKLFLSCFARIFFQYVTQVFETLIWNGRGCANLVAQ